MTSDDVGCDRDWRECSGGSGSEEKASELLWWVERTRTLWDAIKHEEPVPGSTASLMPGENGTPRFYVRRSQVRVTSAAAALPGGRKR